MIIYSKFQVLPLIAYVTLLSNLGGDEILADGGNLVYDFLNEICFLKTYVPNFVLTKVINMARHRGLHMESYQY